MITDTPREKELETRDEHFLAEVKDKRVAVLLSGGVDSSVVVWEFARLGLHPDCFYIKIGPEEKEEWDCSSEEDLEMATAVARKYGCKLEVVDCHQEYWNEVTRYTMDKVKAGFTPNPDVMCNRLIKFGAFDEKMGHNYDLIATGHYAQTETDENGDKWLVTSPDPVKDQTDFLAQIESWQLRKAIFPIGHHIKNEIREIAEEEHLINAKRKDSQGICFLGQINYNDYIRRYLGEKPGDVIEMETGKRIGGHKGLWFHTIGQRKGSGLRRRTLVRNQEGCGEEYSLCESRLRPSDSVQEGFPASGFPFPHPRGGDAEGNVQDSPYAGVSSSHHRKTRRWPLDDTFRRGNPRRGSRPVLRGV